MGHTQGIGSLVAKPAEGMQIFFKWQGQGRWLTVQTGIGGGVMKKIHFFFPTLFLISVIVVLKIEKLSGLSGTLKFLSNSQSLKLKNRKMNLT